MRTKQDTLSAGGIIDVVAKAVVVTGLVMFALNLTGWLVAFAWVLVAGTTFGLGLSIAIAIAVGMGVPLERKSGARR